MQLQSILLRPVPDFTQARSTNSKYREYPLRTDVARNEEPLVDVAQYGLAGQSYYSRRNALTEEPLSGVEPTILVRRSIAEKLASINYELQQSDEVAELLHGRVELYIDEGLRSAEVQQALYDRYIPELVRSQHPTWDERQVKERCDQMVSRPSAGSASPAPHATGAAVDLKLRYMQTNLGFVPHVMVPMGGPHTTTSDLMYPDFFEHKKVVSKDDEEARRNRRVFYWVMRGALNGDDFGFVVNPTEWWHWSFGDQMWAARTQAPAAFFGLADK